MGAHACAIAAVTKIAFHQSELGAIILLSCTNIITTSVRVKKAIPIVDFFIDNAKWREKKETQTRVMWMQ